MSRLTIDLTPQQHQSIKASAALQGKTINQYALERLFPGSMDADQTWQELTTVLGARIDEGLAGKISGKSVGEILDEELALRRCTLESRFEEYVDVATKGVSV